MVEKSFPRARGGPFPRVRVAQHQLLPGISDCPLRAVNSIILSRKNSMYVFQREGLRVRAGGSRGENPKQTPRCAQGPVQARSHDPEIVT